MGTAAALAAAGWLAGAGKRACACASMGLTAPA